MLCESIGFVKRVLFISMYVISRFTKNYRTKRKRTGELINGVTSF